jgi:hypothetical protein
VWRIVPDNTVKGGDGEKISYRGGRVVEHVAPRIHPFFARASASANAPPKALFAGAFSS